jgi:cold-inducible RNA-binding protein
MKLFVGNLPFSVDGPELQRIFEESGVTVDRATVITDKISCRSRGFGFVETPEGQAAIDKLDSLELDGRMLTINEAKQQEGRPAGNGGYRAEGARR